MTRACLMFTLLAALLVGVACADNPTGSAGQGGTLTLRLTTPHSDDGALVFELSGAPVDSLTVSDGSLRLFTRRAGGSIIGAVVGPLANGAIVTLRVPDVRGTGYTATVVEVADRQDALRASLVGYALTVSR